MKIVLKTLKPRNPIVPVLKFRKAGKFIQTERRSTRDDKKVNRHDA